MKTLLAACALAFAPALAFAECSGYGHSTTASQCGDGMIWDLNTQSCITSTTS